MSVFGLLYIWFTTKTLLQIKSHTNIVFVLSVESLITYFHHDFSESEAFVVSQFWIQSFPTLEKAIDNIGKTVLAFSLLNIAKEILCPCNFLVSRVYYHGTAITNKNSLLHYCELGVKGIWLFISLCGSL